MPNYSKKQRFTLRLGPAGSGIGPPQVTVARMISHGFQNEKTFELTRYLFPGADECLQTPGKAKRAMPLFIGETPPVSESSRRC